MIYIGTSGWQYDHWQPRFYPKGLVKTAWLRAFADVFPTVEVNNTFYRMPEGSTFVRWREQTPRGFIVTVKASRFITHIKRLKDCAEPLERLWSNCTQLREKLGPVLFQLPPRFEVDVDRLDTFCSLLPAGMRAAFEFRDPSWETHEVYEVLDGVGAAFVLADWPHHAAPDVVTGDWSYVRLHKGGPVRPGYSRRKLATWAKRLEALPAKDVFVYFNNDTGGAALRDADTLTGLLVDRGVDVAGPRRGHQGRKAG